MKKALSLILAAVMAFSACTASMTALANEKKRAESSAEAVYELANELLQVGTIRNYLEKSGIQVTEDMTVSDLIEALSPRLLKSMVKETKKEDFLYEKYGSAYTENKDSYNEAFAPLDTVPGENETQWLSFYTLYKFCENGESTDNAALKKYCKDTKKELDKLIEKCEKNLDMRVASDAAVRALCDYDADDNRVTLCEIEGTGSMIEGKTLGEVKFTGLSADEEKALVTKLLGKDKEYYYYYYKNIFKKIGMEDELDSAAKLYFYHVLDKGKIILNTYIYLYLMEKSENTLTAEKLTDDAEKQTTELKTSTLLSAIKATTKNTDGAYSVDTTKVYQVLSFTNAYLTKTGNGGVFVTAKVNDTARNKCYDGYWAYGIFDKYFAKEADYVAGLDTAVTEYATLLKELNKEASLVSSPSADVDTLGDQMLDAIGDKADMYKINEHGFKVADYFANEICNKKEVTIVDPYDYNNYNNLSGAACVYAANDAFNTSILSTLQTVTTFINLETVLGVDVDLSKLIENVWVDLYEKPGETIINLLPELLAIADSLSPVVFHDDIDDKNGISNLFYAESEENDPHKPQHFVDDLFLTPDGLLAGITQMISGSSDPMFDLYSLTQTAGNTEVGIGALHVDLNRTIPAILDWFSGNKSGAMQTVGTYCDVEYYDAILDENGHYMTETDPESPNYGKLKLSDEKKIAHYDSRIPRFVNIYFIDKMIYEAKDNVPEEIAEVLAVLRSAVGEYLDSVDYLPTTGTTDKKYILDANGKYVEANDGLNNYKVAFPKVWDIFAKKYLKQKNKAYESPFNLSSKVKTRDLDGVTETYNADFEKILAFVNADNTSENATSLLNLFFDTYGCDYLNIAAFLLDYALAGEVDESVFDEPFTAVPCAVIEEHSYAELIATMKSYIFAYKEGGYVAGRAAFDMIHTYDNGVVTKAATCGAEGEKTFTCSVCGVSYTESVPATGDHNFTGAVTRPATCAEAGEMKYTCTGCGESYIAVIPVTDVHTFDDGVVTKAATCGAKGEKTFTCSVCGASYTESVPATGDHNFTVAVTKPATCGDAGEELLTCTTCNATETRAIPATGKHSYDKGKVTAATAKTYTVTYTCTTCKKTYKKTFNKAKNTLAVKVNKKSFPVKFASVKKAAVKLKTKKLYKVTNNKGAVSFAIAKKVPGFTVDKAGNIKIKKGTKKGTYTIKVKVTAKGTNTFLAGSKTVKVKIVVS